MIETLLFGFGLVSFAAILIFGFMHSSQPEEPEAPEPTVTVINIKPLNVGEYEVTYKYGNRTLVAYKVGKYLGWLRANGDELQWYAETGPLSKAIQKYELQMDREEALRNAGVFNPKPAAPPVLVRKDGDTSPIRNPPQDRP